MAVTKKQNKAGLAVLLLSVSSFFVGFARGEFPDYPMTRTEMKVRAGYFTEGGRYRGGIPNFDGLSREIYECVNDDYFVTAAGVATVCMQWRADESAGGTFQLGSCECKFVHDEAYCDAWVCVQVKQEEDCNGNAENCYITTNTDSVLCQCDVENKSGLYCDSWSCKQIDSEGRVELEEYHCQREAESGHYCEAWNGNVTASDEIEVVTCQCVAEWSGDRVCSYWECEELGLNICASSRSGWCDVDLSVGVGGGLGFLGILAFGIELVRCSGREEVSLTALFVMCSGIVWSLGWSSAVVVWGGVDGSVIVGIWWGTGLLVVFVMSFYYARRARAEQGKAPSQDMVIPLGVAASGCKTTSAQRPTMPVVCERAQQRVELFTRNTQVPF